MPIRTSQTAGRRPQMSFRPKPKEFKNDKEKQILTVAD